MFCFLMYLLPNHMFVFDAAGVSHSSFCNNDLLVAWMLNVVFFV
jgi:hypothetical protein